MEPKSQQCLIERRTFRALRTRPERQFCREKIGELAIQATIFYSLFFASGLSHLLTVFNGHESNEFSDSEILVCPSAFDRS